MVARAYPVSPCQRRLRLADARFFTGRVELRECISDRARPPLRRHLVRCRTSPQRAGQLDARRNVSLRPCESRRTPWYSLGSLSKSFQTRSPAGPFARRRASRPCPPPPSTDCESLGTRRVACDAWSDAGCRRSQTLPIFLQQISSRYTQFCNLPTHRTHPSPCARPRPTAMQRKNMCVQEVRSLYVSVLWTRDAITAGTRSAGFRREEEIHHHGCARIG